MTLLQMLEGHERFPKDIGKDNIFDYDTLGEDFAHDKCYQIFIDFLASVEIDEEMITETILSEFDAYDRVNVSLSSREEAERLATSIQANIISDVKGGR